MKKQIQEKIKNYKPAFQEGDWLAMEQILDKKSKKAAFIPWWKYGVAAACVIGLFITAGVYQNSQNQKNLTDVVLFSNVKRIKSKIQFSKKEQQTALAANIILKTTEEEPIIVKNKKLSSKKTSISCGTQNLFAPLSIVENAFSQPNISTANASTEQELLSVNIMELSLDNLLELHLKEEKQEEIILKKNPKKLVQFLVGLDVGALANIKLENTSNTKSLNIYSDVFSDAGLNFQAVFKNTVGVYTGIKYADRKSFSVPDASIVGSTNVLLSSNSKIEGINIPIGIYLNLYNQMFCSIYTKIGINNIIPIKESINYETIDRSIAAPIENTTNIGNTSFISTSDNSMSIDKKNVSYSNSLNTNLSEPIKHDMKQNPNEKYLGEFQFSIGVKVKASNHLAFTLEPSYLLDFKNADRPENTSNITLNTGILYTF